MTSRPVYGTGDVIGCCLNFFSNQVSFTKNGMLLGIISYYFIKGVAFNDIMKKPLALYPAVGLRTPNEVIEVNFGQKPFRFDIVQYCAVFIHSSFNDRMKNLNFGKKSIVLNL